ncbi:MAG: divergent PAP2 family protein [Clostridia bacterium]
MREWSSILDNRVLITAAMGWFVAQLMKVVLVWCTGKKLDISRMVGSGGMPSSHSAFTTALMMAIGFQEGFGSPLFALSAVFALVVMYDAAGVRRAAGRQAVVLNKILQDMLEGGKWLTNEQLKELIGHTPIEVIAGALVGILVAVLMA